MSLLYCRRCDLAFCERHLDAHPDLEGHELAPDDRPEFCAVCAGLYRPAPKEQATA